MPLDGSVDKPVAHPLVSADGQFWWNGAQWVPFTLQPEVLAKKGGPLLKVGAVFVGLGILGAAAVGLLAHPKPSPTSVAPVPAALPAASTTMSASGCYDYAVALKATSVTEGASSSQYSSGDIAGATATLRRAEASMSAAADSEADQPTRVQMRHYATDIEAVAKATFNEDARSLLKYARQAVLDEQAVIQSCGG